MSAPLPPPTPTMWKPRFPHTTNQRWFIGLMIVGFFVLLAAVGAVAERLGVGDETDSPPADIGATIAGNTWRALSASGRRDICDSVDRFSSEEFIHLTMEQFPELLPYRADFKAVLDQNC